MKVHVDSVSPQRCARRGDRNTSPRRRPWKRLAARVRESNRGWGVPAAPAKPSERARRDRGLTGIVLQRKEESFLSEHRTTLPESFLADLGFTASTSAAESSPPGGRQLTIEVASTCICPRISPGKSVLDIGAYDGFFSFEAERRGARRVVATDQYCWENPRGWETGKVSKIAHDALRSPCVKRNSSPSKRYRRRPWESLTWFCSSECSTTRRTRFATFAP